MKKLILSVVFILAAAVFAKSHTIYGVVHPDGCFCETCLDPGR